jgi:hypothetical protein
VLEVAVDVATDVINEGGFTTVTYAEPVALTVAEYFLQLLPKSRGFDIFIYM